MHENRASATARIVALNILAMSGRHPGLVGVECAAYTESLLRAQGRWPSFLAGCVRRNAFSPLFRLYEFLTIPGLALHQALRKRRLEEIAVDALGSGFRQMVVLGGGLDTLAARMAAAHPGAVFLEIDHPATQPGKKRALEAAGYLRPNFHLVAADFNRQKLADVLNSHAAFRSGEPALFICEGVLMYLDSEAVDAVFATLASLPCPRLRFAFTFMEPTGKGIGFSGSRPWVNAWLKWRGEKFTWGMPAPACREFLAQRGFSLLDMADGPELLRRHVRDREHGLGCAAAGETVALADTLRPGR